MKKFILGVALIFSVASLQAQDIRIGPKVGINIAGIANSAVNSPHFKVGSRVGGFVEIGISEDFFLQPELLYSLKGSGIGDFKINDNYLAVPIMAKYAFVNSGDLQIFGQAGPYLGYLMYTKYKNNGDNETSFNNDFDIGAQLGAGAAYRVGSGAIKLDARVGFSIDGVNQAIGSDLPTNVVLPSVTAGYAFDL